MADHREVSLLTPPRCQVAVDHLPWPRLAVAACPQAPAQAARRPWTPPAASLPWIPPWEAGLALGCPQDLLPAARRPLRHQVDPIKAQRSIS